jgi:hypothetical protein
MSAMGGGMAPSPVAMQRQMVERAKQELKALTQQRNIAEQGIEALTNTAAELSTALAPGMPNTDYSREHTRAILSALVALCSIRLIELQTGHANAMERIPILEKFIADSSSGLVVPTVVI